MNNNCFETLCDVIAENGRMNSFKIKHRNAAKCVFANDDISYEIIYDSDSSQVELFQAQEESLKKISLWLLSEKESSSKDIRMIAEDFIESMAGKPSVKKNQIIKKAKEDESNITGLFVANRMATVFPELKDSIQKEKENYEIFRAATFIKENVLPKINELLKLENQKSKINKIGKLLSELYQNGTLDARSIITMAILNGIEPEQSYDVLRSAISPELQKAWDAALKYKGKTVKPEKAKKIKSMLSRALEAQNG